MRPSADAKVRGRFSETRRGPAHRCARSASAALENFVRHPQKTFSTVSVICDRFGPEAGPVMSAVLPKEVISVIQSPRPLPQAVLVAQSARALWRFSD